MNLKSELQHWIWMIQNGDYLLLYVSHWIILNLLEQIENMFLKAFVITDYEFEIRMP